MNSTLQSGIDSWDGKSATHLEQVFDNHRASPTFFVELIAMSGNETRQAGSTWLLKKHFEEGFSPTTRQASAIMDILSELVGWEAKLHILQCLPRMTFPRRAKSKLLKFLPACLESDNKFVRAWAFNGRFELARQFPEYRDEVLEELETAVQNESASVRARVRKALARGFES